MGFWFVALTSPGLLGSGEPLALALPGGGTVGAGEFPRGTNFSLPKHS